MKTRVILIWILIVASHASHAQTLPSADEDCTSFFDSTLQRKIYMLADKIPEYPGGLDKLLSFFSENYIYPPTQVEFQGIIHMTFIVEPDGTISNIDVSKRFYKDRLSPVEMESIRVFKLMSAFTAAECNGTTVPFKIIIPIRF